jgi:drug/metabolite transporter (DMT)-like permease
LSVQTTPSTWETPRPLVPELALIAATCAYGATFKIVQDALEDVTPVGFILLRFSIGAVVLAPFALARGWRRTDGAPSARTSGFLRWVMVFGVVGFVGYWFQNAGLQHTTTSNSAFITGLFVVFTPLIETVATRRAPARNVLFAVALSVVGLFLLEGGSLSMNKGDALTLGCAFMFGLWIFLGGELAQKFDPIALTAGQLAVFALLAIPVVALDGMGEITARVVFAVLVTGIFCSAIAFTLQLWGQRWVEPSRAAVILQFEPIVAGVVGFAVGERLGVSGYLGAVVIMLGILVAESRSWRSEKRGTNSLDRAVKPSEESTQ